LQLLQGVALNCQVGVAVLLINAGLLQFAEVPGSEISKHSATAAPGDAPPVGSAMAPAAEPVESDGNTVALPTTNCGVPVEKADASQVVDLTTRYRSADARVGSPATVAACRVTDAAGETGTVRRDIGPYENAPGRIRSAEGVYVKTPGPLDECDDHPPPTFDSIPNVPVRNDASPIVLSTQLAATVVAPIPRTSPEAASAYT